MSVSNNKRLYESSFMKSAWTSISITGRNKRITKKSTFSLLRNSNDHHELHVNNNFRNHMHVICQANGSIWPRVFPYCLLNTIFAAVLWYFVNERGVYFKFSNDANSYIASLLSFLVVSRIRMIYDRRSYVRERLEILCKSCEELIQNSVLLTAQNDSISARKWRADLAYMTILLLKNSFCAFRRHSEIMQATSGEISAESKEEDISNFKVPLKIVVNLKKKIMQHRLDSRLKGKMFSIKTINEEFRVLGFIDNYSAGA